MKKLLVVLFILSLLIPSMSFARDFNFGDGTSKTLVTKSWNALQTKDFEAVMAYVDKCLSRYSKKALKQQSSLTEFAPKEEANNYWALNDVATCLFIKGKALREQGKKDESIKTFEDIIKNYTYSQCWDPNGWFWKQSEGAKDQILGIQKNVDFGNYSSETLTKKCWNSLQSEQYEEVLIYTDKCVSLFGKTANEQQASLKDFASNEKAFDYWALNDVATCLYIKASALKKLGKKDEAKKVLQEIIDDYSFAQCWDTQGWFWKVSSGAKNEIVAIDMNVNFGNSSSETLTVKAWDQLGIGQHEKVAIYVDKCLELYEKKARDMQASLSDYAGSGKEFDYWALNDVATCLFVKGKSLKEQNKKDEAKKIFNEIIDNYSYAQCWDTRGWFWKPAQGAKNELDSIDLAVNFGNFTSEELTGKAWEALGLGKYNDVDKYVNKCLELYGKKARDMQASLKDYAEDGKEFDYWALNDVATCLFVQGRAYYIQGKNDEAKKVYNNIIKNYSFAQTWDTQGWFWRPIDGAKDQVLLMDTGIDFGDYTSQTLTTRAWQALDAGSYDEVLVYTRKCIQLYGKTAIDMQTKLDSYLPKDNAFDVWALNDVGTCHFIMGEAYLGKKEFKRAIDTYKTLVETYFYAQCWDTKGWFWKPAVAARGKINKIAAEHGLM